MIEFDVIPTPAGPCTLEIEEGKLVRVHLGRRSSPEARRTAGWTAVPVAAEVIRRCAPLLGLRPLVEPVAQIGVTLASTPSDN